MTQLRTIKDLKLDTKNANKGTERGRKLIAESLAKYGAGRSILVDRRGRVIAGNKTLEALRKNGQRIRVVETDGKELVVVQRTDLDLDSRKARELAIADNRTGELDLEWDPAVLQKLDVDLSQFWNDAELKVLLSVPPSAFAEVGDDITVEHTCPRCGYKFNGGKKEAKKRAAGRK